MIEEMRLTLANMAAGYILARCLTPCYIKWRMRRQRGSP